MKVELSKGKVCREFPGAVEEFISMHHHVPNSTFRVSTRNF
jgi:hypothetical protein